MLSRDAVTHEVTMSEAPPVSGLISLTGRHIIYSVLTHGGLKRALSYGDLATLFVCFGECSSGGPWEAGVLLAPQCLPHSAKAPI